MSPEPKPEPEPDIPHPYPEPSPRKESKRNLYLWIGLALLLASASLFYIFHAKPFSKEELYIPYIDENGNVDFDKKLEYELWEDGVWREKGK